MERNVNPLLIRGYELSGGLDSSKMKETAYKIEILDPKKILNSEKKQLGEYININDDYYFHDIDVSLNQTSTASSEDAITITQSTATSIIPPTSTLIKNILQVGQQYWFSVTTLYVAFAIDQDETSTTSIGRSARHLAFPNSIYHEQTCIPPLIPIDTNAYYEHLLMLESQDSSTIQLSNIAEDEMACCEKDEYFQDNSLENSTEMSGNDLILYKLCKPCPTNAICEGRSYKLIRPKKGSWKVDWKEPQIALQYLPCLKEVACLPHGCEVGYTGVLCGSCDNGYAFRGGACVTCENAAAFVATIITSIFLFIFLLLFYIFKTKEKKLMKPCRPIKKTMKKYYQPLTSFLRLLKIIINFTQVTSVLSSTMASSEIETPGKQGATGGKTVPSNFDEFASYFTVFNADLFTLLSIDCSVGTLSYFHKMVILCCLPYMLLLLSKLYEIKQMRGLKKKIKKGKNKSFKYKKIKKSFQYVDTDNSGKINKEEFFLALSDIKRLKMDKEETNKLFDEVVKETDDKKLTLADFVSLIVNSKAGFNGQLYVDHMNEIAVKTKVYGATVQLLIFLHTPITQKLLEFYKCIQVPTSGGPEYPTRYYVASDTRFECFKEDWYFYLPFNIFFLITFSLAIPGFMIFILLHFRKKLQSLEVSDSFGYFYKRSRPGAEWWQLLEITRRFVLTSVLSLIAFEGVKIGLALLVSTLILVLLNYFRPHKEEMYFWMTNITYCATVVLFISVSVISILLKSPEAAKIQDSLGIFLIVVHIVVFVLMMVVIRIGTKDLLQKYEETKNMNKEEEIENNRIIELVEIGNDSNADDIETGNIIENPMLVEKGIPSPKQDNMDISETSSSDFNNNDMKKSNKTEEKKKTENKSDFSLPNNTKRRRRKSKTKRRRKSGAGD